MTCSSNLSYVSGQSASVRVVDGTTTIILRCSSSIPRRFQYLHGKNTSSSVSLSCLWSTM